MGVKAADAGACDGEEGCGWEAELTVLGEVGDWSRHVMREKSGCVLERGEVLC